MENFAFALAIVGVAASCAYCTVQTDQTGWEERRFRIETCVKQGGLWTKDGWGSLYCKFPEAKQ